MGYESDSNEKNKTNFQKLAIFPINTNYEYEYTQFT